MAKKDTSGLDRFFKKGALQEEMSMKDVPDLPPVKDGKREDIPLGQDTFVLIRKRVGIQHTT